MPSLKPSELSMRQLRDLVNDRLPSRISGYGQPVASLDTTDKVAECPRYAVPLTGMGG